MARSQCRTTLAADGTRIAYRDFGDGKEAGLVLLHSLGADGAMWDECRRLLPVDARVVVPDTRGHGASGAAVDVSVDTWVDDLRVVLESASMAKSVLVGVSMGGIQALAFAAKYPELVEGLVVADSFAALEPRVAARKIRALCERVRQSPMEVVAAEYLAETFREPYPPGAQSVARAIAGMGPNSYAASVRACFGTDIENRLGGVVSPTLVLWGDRDNKTPRDLSEAIASQVPKGHLSVVPDAGHLSNIDNPDAFIAEVTAWQQALCRGVDITLSQGGN